MRKTRRIVVRPQAQSPLFLHRFSPPLPPSFWIMCASVVRPASATPPNLDALIDYPCLFPIKVMGANVDGFVDTMVAVARQFDPSFEADTRIELRQSKGGNYLGITLTVMATDREQLDNLYRALSGHPMVKVAL